VPALDVAAVVTPDVMTPAVEVVRPVLVVPPPVDVVDVEPELNDVPPVVAEPIELPVDSLPLDVLVPVVEFDKPDVVDDTIGTIVGPDPVGCDWLPVDTGLVPEAWPPGNVVGEVPLVLTQ
jgi:hypothetical protein